MLHKKNYVKKLIIKYHLPIFSVLVLGLIDIIDLDGYLVSSFFSISDWDINFYSMLNVIGVIFIPIIIAYINNSNNEEKYRFILIDNVEVILRNVAILRLQDHAALFDNLKAETRNEYIHRYKEVYQAKYSLRVTSKIHYKDNEEIISIIKELLELVDQLFEYNEGEEMSAILKRTKPIEDEIYKGNYEARLVEAFND